MKIEVEFKEGDGWKVTLEDKYAHGLCWEEMLGLVTEITYPTKRRCIGWLKTAEQHEEERKLYNKPLEG